MKLRINYHLEQLMFLRIKDLIRCAIPEPSSPGEKGWGEGGQI